MQSYPPLRPLVHHAALQKDHSHLEEQAAVHFVVVVELYYRQNFLLVQNVVMLKQHLPHHLSILIPG